MPPLNIIAYYNILLYRYISKKELFYFYFIKFYPIITFLCVHNDEEKREPADREKVDKRAFMV